MSLSPGALLSVLLVPALLGAALLRLQGVGPRTDRLAFGGWAWIQGCLGLAVVLTLWLWLGLPLQASSITFVVLALGVILLLLGRRVPLAEPRESSPFPR